MPAPAVGIDLGTTNSVVAVSIGGRPQVLTDASGYPLIPSVVSFTPDGERLLGRPARARRPLDPAHTVSSVKRLLGRPFKSEEVRRARSRVAFELKEGPDSSVLVSTRGGDFSLPELSAMVLREVRRIAEASLQERLDKTVITVPANFNELQRSSTKVAGKIAELDIIRILNEPTAAALAYGYGRGTREKICIFDFGGGTFDVTLLELSGNVFEVLATAGDTFLGGDDIDIAITDSLTQNFQRSTQIDASRDRVAYDVLRDAVETAKCELSTQDTARVNLNADVPGHTDPVRFQHTLTRADLEKISAPFVTRTFDVCSEALKLASLRPTDLTAVILVGGSTRIPAVRQRVASFFGRDPLTSLPPEEVVALGASILAEALTGGARRAASRPPAAPNARASAPQASPPTSDSPRQVGTVTTRRTVPPPVPPGAGAPSAVRAPTIPPTTAAPAAPVPVPTPAAAAPTADTKFDLDDPFLDKPTVAIPTPTLTPEQAAAARAIARPRDSDMMWEPRRAADAANPAAPGISSLDEPSFMGKLPGGRSQVAPPEPTREVGVRTGSVPAFNLDDPSVIVPLPRADVGSSTVLAPPPVLPPTGKEISAPRSLPDGPVPPAPAPRETSVPSFNIDADDIFAGASTVAQPSPFSSSGSGPHNNPAAPVIPPSISASRPPPMVIAGNVTAKMPTVAPPPTPPSRPVVPPSAGNRPALPQAVANARPEVSPPAHGLRGNSQPPMAGGVAPLLLDVTPFSLGVETAGGLCETVVKRNATIPVEQTRVFATTNDGQESVVIRIAQGESRRFADDQFLGELELIGLRQAARGEVSIAVTFELEADGTLRVRAKDIESGREQATRVTLLTVPTESQQADMVARNRSQSPPAA